MTADGQTDPDLPTPYVPDRPKTHETAEQLRARIPGWGVDLDPAGRPSYPRLRYDPDATGAHWRFPERQPGAEDRHGVPRHKMPASPWHWIASRSSRTPCWPIAWYALPGNRQGQTRPLR